MPYNIKKWVGARVKWEFMRLSRFFRPAAFFSFLGIFFPLILNSCSQISGAINEPVREYFERGSEVVQIISYDILTAPSFKAAPTAKDRDGHTCVGSTKDIVVVMHLSNPQNLIFQQGQNLYFNFLDPDTAALPGADSVTLQQGSDPSVLELRYPSAFLTTVEQHTLLSENISILIKLSHPETGITFPSFNLPLYCNTAPPAFPTDSGSTVIYKTLDASPKYVVCFTVPVLPSEQFDLAYLQIGETTIPIAYDSADESFTYDTAAYPALHRGSVVNYAAPISSTPLYVDNGILYHNTEGEAFFYVTDDLVSAGDKLYTISLVDKAGLMSSTSVSTVAYRINDAKLIHIESGTAYAGNSSANPTADDINLSQDSDDFYSTVKISIPTKASGGGAEKTVSGVTVNYVVNKTGAPAPIATGTESSDFELTLEPGIYDIECTASKASFTESVTTFHVTVKGSKVYVKSTGIDATATGSKDAPFATIGEADLWFFRNSTVAESPKTIYVLDNITYTAPNTIAFTECIDCMGNTLTDIQLNLSCVLKNATIAGTNTSKQIVGGGKTLENVALEKDVTGQVVTAATTLKNVTSTKGNAVNGDNLTIAGKVSGLTFQLDPTKKLTIAGSMAGSSNNTIELTYSTDVPTIAAPREFTVGYGTYNTASPASYFTNASFGVSRTASGEAALAISGGSISVYTPDGKLSLSTSPTSISASSTVATTITISATGTLEDGSTVTAPHAKFTDWNIKAYYEYDYRHATAALTPVATPATGSPLSLSFPAGYPAGNYVIVIFVTFNGTSYSCEIVVPKS